MGLLVWVVYGLISFMVASAWLCVFIPWRWWMSPMGLLHMAFAHTLLGLTVYCYRATVNTCPGRVPAGWIPPGVSAEELQKVILHEEEHQRIKRRRGSTRPRVWAKGALRYCTKCQEFKPPRAHHCSECGVCILKMDHHCPWVGNCVGLGNHRTFILFLVYAIIAMCYACVLFSLRLADIVQAITLLMKSKNETTDPMQEMNMRWPMIDMTLSVINLVIVIPVALSLMCLLGYQLGLLSENVTTIEDYEREVLKKRAKQQGKRDFTWHYDLGSCSENYRQVLGPEVKRWLLPWPSTRDALDPLILNSKDTV